jgi:hypothetical protein
MMGEDFTEKEAIQNQADIQRAEAKRLLNSVFADTQTETVNRVVDCIIDAAIMEMSLMMVEAAANRPTSDNP